MRTTDISVCLSILTLVVTSQMGWSQWSADPLVNTPVCTETHVQDGLTIASDGLGGGIITWHDERNGAADIFVQRISGNGVLQWASNGTPLCTAINAQRYPMITADGTGGAIVAWWDNRNGAADVYTQRINANGEAQWTTDGVALCNVPNDQLNCPLISDGRGGAIVAWVDFVHPLNRDIYAQRIDAAGVVRWTTNGVPLCTASYWQDSPAITGDGAGGAIVAWWDQRNGPSDIYAQRIDSSGAILWAINGVAISTATGQQLYPVIVSDGEGGAIITWYDSRNGQFDIYAQRINSNGIVLWASNGVPLCTAPLTQNQPRISTDGNGGAIVTWADFRNGNWDVYAQRIDSSGSIQWLANGIALCTAANQQMSPVIAPDENGGATVAWSDSCNGTYDIYAQRINSAGVVHWTANGALLSSAPNDQTTPQITSDVAGGAVVAWRDFRNGNWDIYGQHIDARGRLALQLHHFEFAPVASPQTIDVPFSISITARDIYDDLVIDFDGTVDLTTTAGTVTPSVSGAFVNGQWSGNISVSADGISRTITATKTGGTETGTSNTFDVSLPPFTAIDAGMIGSVYASAAWGDYDNDQDLDLLMTAWPGTTPVTKLYRNTGGSFDDIPGPFVGVGVGEGSWADYDNDGDLDILVGGTTGAVPASRLYQNESGVFSEVATAIPNLMRPSFAWGDYDNDGDLDLMYSGITDHNVTGIMRNDGGSFVDPGLTFPMGLHLVSWCDYDNDGDLDALLCGTYMSSGMTMYQNTHGTFAPVDVGLPQQRVVSAAWGDYDGDGDPDIAVSLEAGEQLRIYTNDGGSFALLSGSIQRAEGAVLWGDYDNDGDLDILFSGYLPLIPYPNNVGTRMFSNEGGTFVDIGFHLRVEELEYAHAAALAWGDYDNDGDLDAVVSGRQGNQQITRLLRNNSFTANTPPSLPAAPVTNVQSTSCSFSWGTSTDGQTSTSGLTYNLRVGTTPGGTEIVSPMAGIADGYHRVVSTGPVNGNKNWTLNNLHAGTYYWSVQAIDNAFAGGPFAAEQTFTINIAPVALNDSFTVNEDDTLIVAAPGVLANDTNTTALTAAVVTDVSHGSLSLNSDGSFSYIPLPDFSGSDSFVYLANDGVLRDTAIAQIVIQPVNDAPVMQIFVPIFDISEDDTNNTGMTIEALVGNNISDVDAGALEGVAIWGATTSDGQGVWQFSTDNGSIWTPIGPYSPSTSARVLFSDSVTRIRVRPDGVNGNYDANFSFRAWDRTDGSTNGQPNVSTIPNGGSTPFSTRQIWVTIHIHAVNDAPIIAEGPAVDVGCDEDNSPTAFALTLHASGPEDEPLTWGIAIAATHGTATASGTGRTKAIGYTPVGNFHGADSFVVYVGDPGGLRDSIVVKVAINPVNDEPTIAAIANPAPILEDAPLQTVNLTGISAGGGESQVLTLTATSSNPGLVPHPAATYTGPDTAGALTYTPVPQQSGTAVIMVTVTDDGGTQNGGDNTVSRTFSVTVNPVNDSPSFTKGPDQLIPEDAGTQAVVGWATDISPGPPDESGQILTFDVTNDNNALFSGQPAVSPSGTLTYTPATGVHGMATVTVVLHDNGGTENGGADESDPQTFTVTVIHIVGPLHHFDISTITSPQTVNVSFGITIIAHDINHSTVTDFVGTVDLATTAGTITPSLSGAFVNGQWTGNVSVSDGGISRTISATLSGGTETGTSNLFDILSNIFAEASSLNPGGDFGAWGDIDNDDDLDILVTGAWNTNIFRNTLGNFTNTGAGMLGFYQASGAFGDYDNDGDLDVVVLGTRSEIRYTKLYRNDGTHWVEVPTAFPQLRMGSAAWGDFDNDGDLDLALGGNGDGAIRRCGVYRNDHGVFSDINAGLTGVRYPSLAWGDFDNDADLDLVMTGEGAGDVPVTKLYRNDNGSFVEINVGLVNLFASSAAWGDYDADGDLDLLLTGSSAAAIVARVYNNNSGVFTDIGAGLTGLAGGTRSAAWGDYDNDGDLDIALTGAPLNATKIYRNDGASFTDINAAIYGLAEGSVAWGDYDNDGDLDLLEVGTVSYLTPNVAKVFRNNTATLNTISSAPPALTSNVTGPEATLNWGPSTDGQTPSDGLTYNLRVGTSPGGSEVITPMAKTATGQRLLPASGLTNAIRTRLVKNLSPGTYYWSAQAIDNAFAGGPFAAEQTFIIVGPLHHFTISTIASPQTAGQPFSIAITAQDINNNTVTDFAGTVDFTTTAGAIAPTVSGTFSGGQRVESVVVSQAGSGKTIIATVTGGIEAGASNPFDVSAGDVHHFAFDVISSPQTAGVSFDVTMRALDSLDNVVMDFTGTATLSTTAGAIAPPVSGAFTNGQHTETVKVTQAGATHTITATLTGGTAEGTSNTFDVRHGTLHHYSLDPIGSPQIAGTPFEITITARDSMGNTILLPDTVDVTTTAGTIFPTLVVWGDTGHVTVCVAVTQADTGRTITVQKTGGVAQGTSNPFTVLSGVLHHFAITPIASPQTQGVAFDISMFAQDVHNNTAVDFAGTVNLHASAGLVIPAISGPFMSGQRSETVIATGIGSGLTITATRSAGTETGTSNGFDVVAAPPTSILANPRFESGLAPWMFYTNGTAAIGAGPSPCGSNAAHVSVVVQGTNVQLYQAGVTLQPNTPYRLMFKAYCSTGHDVSVSLLKHTSPYTVYGLNGRVFDLTAECKQFVVEFTTTGFTSPVSDARLMFWFAPYDAAGDHYYIDDVMLGPNTLPIPPQITTHLATQTAVCGQSVTLSVEATGTSPLYYQWKRNGVNIPGETNASCTTPPLGMPDSGAQYMCVVSNIAGTATSNPATLHVITAPANCLANGTFESGTAPWGFYTDAVASFGRVVPGAGGSTGAGQVAITAQGTNVQLYQLNIILEAGATYRLSFSAYSSAGHDMAVFVHKNTSPYGNYGLSNWVVDLTTGWRDFSKTFTATGFTGTTTDSRLRFWFAPYDAAGDKFYIDNVVLEKSLLAKGEVPVEVPAEFSLHQNYPNPFNPLTIVNYQLPVDCHVTLKIYDVLGREVVTLVNEVQEAGYKAVEWDATGFASGVYLYRLQAGEFVFTKKLVLMR